MGRKVELDVWLPSLSGQFASCLRAGSLSRAFAGRIYDKYHYLMYRSILIIVLSNSLFVVVCMLFCWGPQGRLVKPIWLPS